MHERVRAKVDQRAPEVVIAEEGPAAPVINIMDALKKSMQPRVKRANIVRYGDSKEGTWADLPSNTV